MRANGIQGAKRRGKPWRTTIPDPTAARSRRPRQPRLHRRPARRAVAGGLHLPALLGGRRVLQLRDRRLLAAGSSAGSSPATCAPTSSSTRCAWRLTRRDAGADVQLIHHSDAGSQGGFKWSSQRSMRRVAMGRPKGRGAERAGRPVMRSPGRPPVGRREHRQRFWAAIARGERERRGRCRGGRVAGGWRPVVSGGWRDAAGQTGAAVGAVPVVRRAGGDRGAARRWRWGAGDRAPARSLAVDDLPRAAAQCRDAQRSLEYRATTAQWHADRRAQRPKPAKLAVNDRLRGYVQDRLAGACSGLTASPWRGRGRVDRPASRSPQGPALGAVVEPGADLQPAAPGLPR